MVGGRKLRLRRRGEVEGMGVRLDARTKVQCIGGLKIVRSADCVCIR